MGKSGSKGSSTTTVQKADPWTGAQPYLLGQNGNPGVFPQAAEQFNTGGWSDEMQGLTDQYAGNIGAWAPQNTQLLSAAQSAIGGGFDPTVTPTANVNAQMVNPTEAFSSMGAADPTSSLSRLLSGQADTTALNGYMDSAMGRMTDNFQRSVMPSLRSGARLAGQYGSSRQGIAEGLAADGLTDSMSDLSANMYNNAFNTAQQNMYGTANNLSGLALTNAQANANRDLAGQQANAGINFQNNAQQMQLSGQQLGNVTQGANLLGAGMGLDNSAYQNALAAMQAPNAYNQNNLNNYANIISTGAGMGGTSSSSQSTPTTSNPFSSMTGGGLAGAGIGSMMAAPGATGLAALGGWAPMAAGAGLGLLGGLF